MIFIVVVMDRIVSYWFSDRIEFAWGINIAMCRMGTVLNFLATAWISYNYGLDVSTWVGKAI